MLNSLCLVGRVGQDPSVKYFESGKVVCTFTLAVDRMGKKEDPFWFDVEFWGKQAETLGTYLKKGTLISVQGSLRFDYWDDRSTGDQRSKPIVAGDRFKFLGGKKDSEERY